MKVMDRIAADHMALVAALAVGFEDYTARCFLTGATKDEFLSALDVLDLSLTDAGIELLGGRTTPSFSVSNDCATKVFVKSLAERSGNLLTVVSLVKQGAGWRFGWVGAPSGLGGCIAILRSRILSELREMEEGDCLIPGVAVV